MPLSRQAASAHKPCEQTPHMGDEKSRHSKLRRQIKCEGLNGVARSLARCLAVCFTGNSNWGRACSLAGAYNWPWMCIYKKKLVISTLHFLRRI